MNIENTINDKDFFDSNNFTAKTNPTLAALYESLVATTDLMSVSDTVTAIRKKHSKQYGDFLKTLNDDQRSELDNITWTESEEQAAQQTECFIRGFKLAIRLMQEGLTI